MNELIHYLGSERSALFRVLKTRCPGGGEFTGYLQGKDIPGSQEGVHQGTRCETV